MSLIADKIRKMKDDDQTVRSGPGHAGFYVDSNGNLMININEEDGPQQVGADLAGAILSALRQVSTISTSFVNGAAVAGIVIDNDNNAIWIGAQRDQDTEDLIALRVTVIKIELIDDTDGIFAVTTFVSQTPGSPVDENNIGKGISFDSSNFFYGEDHIEHGTPAQFVAEGAEAGPVVVTGIGANDLLVSVIAFTAGVPTNLTSEFTISDADEIDNTGGTDTTGKTLLVTVMARA